MGFSGWLSRVGVVTVWQRTDTVSFLPSRAVAGEAGEQGLTSLIECQLQGEPRKGCAIYTQGHSAPNVGQCLPYLLFTLS